MENKFYWLKLKKDFFKRHDIKIIESMPNGKDYILFYLKLLCESVDHEGNLRFSEQIPYNEDMLSVITNTNVDVVRSAIKIFTELNMMEIMDDGTYFMNEVNKMIGSAADNDNANRQRRFRERKKQLALQERYDSVTKSNESKSIEIELDKDKELDNKKEISKEKNQDGILPPDVYASKDKKHKYGTYGWVKLTEVQYQKLTDEFGKDYIEKVISALDEYVQSNGNKNKYKDFNLVIRKAIREKWFKIDSFSSSSKREIVWEELKPITLEDDIELCRNHPDKAKEILEGMDKYNPERAKQIREALKVGK